jgi:hypothetical protein
LAARWPSTSTSVEFTVRPRSATPEEPAAKPLENALGIEPLLSAEIERTTSDTVVRPLRWICCAEITVTGDGVSTSMRGTAEPVTVMVCNCLAWSCCGVDAGVEASCAKAAPTGANNKPARVSASWLRFMGMASLCLLRHCAREPISRVGECAAFDACLMGSKESQAL